MAIIPGGQQIRTTSSDVDLTPRGNALVKAQNQVYTMDDIVETVNAGGSGSGSLAYTSFVGKISQSGTSNPTVTLYQKDELEDVIISANRFSAGNYSFSFYDSSFSPYTASGNAVVFVSNDYDPTNVGSEHKSCAGAPNSPLDGFSVRVVDGSGANADLEGSIFFEIRFYS